MMNKWISISISGVLVAGLAVSLFLYFQESSNLKDAQTEIDVLEGAISTQELDLWAAKAGVSALETELAAAEARISALEAVIVAAGSANEVEVKILNSSFNPRVITVPLGTTVTWTHLDAANHTVTSNTHVFDASLTFKQTFSYTFTEPGVFWYHCHPHSYMFGRVIVE
ncbi:MAG: cupredoxin domain-containing protein [Dehalococcoidales bacterium]|jgi:plastocyanin